MTDHHAATDHQMMPCRLAALCLALACALALAPQAAAQSAAECGPPLNVAADQWTLVGVSCEQSGGTVVSVFGPDLDSGAGGNASYNLTWVLWRKGYDPVTCAGKADPNNCYIKMAATDPVNAGDAFWLYTTMAATLNFPGTATTTDPFTFTAELASSVGGDRYYLFANPYDDAVNFADLRWTGTLAFFGDFDLTTAEASGGLFLLTNGIVHYWNGNTYFNYDFTNPLATFEPRESVWIEMGLGLAAAFLLEGDVTVEVPNPSP